MDWRKRLSRLPLGGVALLFGSILIAVAFSTVNFGAGLGHVDVKLLSGSTGGNYSAIADRLSARASRRGGTIENVPSNGSVDNVQRLIAGKDDCDVDFALVQDGVPIPATDDLELIGRLPGSEAVFVIARDATRFARFSDLRGLRVGIGPARSGTDYLARSLFDAPDLQRLGLRLSNHALTEQLDLVANGGLDLAVFVLDDNAQLIRSALVDRGLQMVSLEHLEAIPTRVSFVSVGSIRAGQYDLLAPLPAHDHPVLRVDTLVIGNRCASRSVEIGVLEVLNDELPGYLATNAQDRRGGPLRHSTVAREFYSSEGPGFADQYVPWLVDIMPLGNWFYIAMSVSVLFNLMTLWHKVRLWRVDANRDKGFQIVRDVLGERLTPAEIATLEPTDAHRTDATRERLDTALRDLDALRAKTREHENSMLVPLGAEWMYRYEEEQIEALLAALRTFRGKL